MAKKKPAKKKPKEKPMKMTHQQATDFLSQGGMQATPDHAASAAVQSLVETMNEIQAKGASFWDIFAKASAIFAIWTRPGTWDANDIIARATETKNLFFPAVPAPNMP